MSLRQAAAVALLAASALAVACGGGPSSGPPARAASANADGGGAPRSELPSEREKQDEPASGAVDAFLPTSGPGDAPVPFVRDERSSRLDVSVPPGRTRAHETWRAKLEGAKREACRPCPMTERSFVVAAGNRVALVEADRWQLFDAYGRRIDSGKVESGAVRLDRAGGTIVKDDTRPADAPPDARIASRRGLVVSVSNGAVVVGERSIEGKFDVFDVAIDESDVAIVAVRQGKDVLMWTVPLLATGSIGRQKIPVTARRVLGPPVLGKRLRVLSLDTGLVALGLDGKRVWERRGLAPSGGVSITSDDTVLVADGGRVLAIDPRGKAEEVFVDREAVFVTPPILGPNRVLYVASGELLHAAAF